MQSKRVYGIDLGTTYSCIAYVDEYGKPVVVPNSEGELTTPSVVFFENETNITVGQTALEQAKIQSKRCVATVKRVMGSPHWEFLCDGKRYKPQEISALILRKLVEDAQQHTRDTIKDVVITCPAYFGVNQKEATKQAGEIAGLNVHYVIPEPTAAALAYAMDQEDDQVIMVYDLGGGTFDVTFIELKDKAITVLATAGDNDLGGKNWDDAIVAYFAHSFEAQTGVPASDLLHDMEIYQELLMEAERTKRALSIREVVTRKLRFRKEATIELTRTKFEELTANLLALTFGFVDDMIAAARARNFPEITKILLVGGSTYMPQVLNRMKQYPYQVIQYRPNMAVAEGAAIFGHRCLLQDVVKEKVEKLTGRTGGEIILESTDRSVIEEAVRAVANEFNVRASSVKALIGRKVTNVTSKSFGIVVIDAATRTEMVYNLITRNDRVPCQRTENFETFEDNQISVFLRLMENLEQVRAGELLSISRCKEINVTELPFGRPVPRGSEIRVTFALTGDGLLEMHAVDLTTNREVRVKKKTASVMSSDEVERARARSAALVMN